MVRNYAKLLGKIKECDLTQEKLAALIGKDKTTLNSKLNGRGRFTDIEMCLICEQLKIPKEDLHSYFFAE